MRYMLILKIAGMTQYGQGECIPRKNLSLRSHSRLVYHSHGFQMHSIPPRPHTRLAKIEWSYMCASVGFRSIKAPLTVRTSRLEDGVESRPREQAALPCCHQATYFLRDKSATAIATAESYPYSCESISIIDTREDIMSR